MFARHYVAFCPVCGETTPHEDHTFGRRLSIAFGVAGIVLLLLPAAFSLDPWVSLTCMGIPIVRLIRRGMWSSFDSNERNVNEHCTRCRYKAHLFWRKKQPNPRNSTIDPF
jgi:uncharacterized paraquat-inducible protein A